MVSRNCSIVPDLFNEPEFHAFLETHGWVVHEADATFGHGCKSVGWRVDDRTWLRSSRRSGREQERLWTGSTAAAAHEVPGPRLIQRHAWRSGSTEWALEIYPLARGHVLSRNMTPPPELETHLSQSWWSDLSCRLRGIATWPTARTAVTQELVSRRLAQALPGIDPNRFVVERWAAGHADLHWQNLTDQCEILDWEAWGLVPAGFDVATLWTFSLGSPSLALKVLNELAGDARGSRDFRISMAFMLVEVLRMAERSNEYAPLREPAAQRLGCIKGELARG